MVSSGHMADVSEEKIEVNIFKKLPWIALAMKQINFKSVCSITYIAYNINLLSVDISKYTLSCDILTIYKNV